MAGTGKNGWKLLEIYWTGWNRWKWMAIIGNDWRWREMGESLHMTVYGRNLCTWLEMDGIGRKGLEWQELLNMDGNG